MQEDSIRLNKFISDSGHCSRREADRLIEDGVVKVNGRTASCGQRISPSDEVEVQAQRIKAKKPTETIYIAFNKPEGITCTSEAHVKGNIIDYINYMYICKTCNR